MGFTQNDFWTLFAMILYLLVLVVIGVVYARVANRSSNDYFIGGRRLGSLMAAMSAEASDMSGWLLMGLPGVAYFTGASSAMWTAIGLAIGTYLNWLFVAKPLRRYSEKLGAITIPDFFSARFGDKKKVLMLIASLMILLFFSIYVGSCFVTTGKLFHQLFGWNYQLFMIVGGVVVFAYTLLGGYLAGAASDLMQGILMFFALVVVVIGSICMVGGVDQVAQLLQAIPGFLSPVQNSNPLAQNGALLSSAGSGATQGISASGQPMFGPADSKGIVITTIISGLAWGLGYFGMPQVLVKFMGIKKASMLKRSRRIAIIWCVISLAAAIAIGLVGRALMMERPDLTSLVFGTSSSAENIFIALSQIILPGFICGIVVSGIMAATMSSANSYMLITCSAIAKNLFQGLFKKDASERQVLWVSRVTMVVVLLFGVVIAWQQDSSIFQVVSFAWAGFGSAFAPLVLLSLFWRRTNLPGAISGMVAGAAVMLGWHFLGVYFPAFGGGIFTLYELAPGFICGLLVNLAVSLATKPPAPAVLETFDAYKLMKSEEEKVGEVA
jgi:sodium/proline symporter